MSPALLHRSSSAVRTPSRVVRDLVDAHRRRETDDLRRRAEWVAQARHTPTLEDWTDWLDDDPADQPARGTARIARRLARRG
jgi:hypothetical protein